MFALFRYFLTTGSLLTRAKMSIDVNKALYKFASSSSLAMGCWSTGWTFFFEDRSPNTSLAFSTMRLAVAVEDSLVNEVGDDVSESEMAKFELWEHKIRSLTSSTARLLYEVFEQCLPFVKLLLEPREVSKH